MITERHPFKLKLRAIYEVAVGLLLAQKDMNSETENLAHYFESVVNFPDNDVPTDLLLDASVLLTFSTVAVETHQVGLLRKQVAGWHEALIAKTARVLDRTSSVTLRCDLLQAQAQLYVVESIEKGELPGDKAFAVWLKLADAAESAPLFPLERFANFVTECLPYLARHPSYRTLANKIDALLEKRVGSRAAAEKCRERAMAFFEIGDVLAAIAELHDAKVKWYSRETIVPSLLTVLNISGFYEHLGLKYAAKQYALAAASLAFWSDIPEAKKIASSAVAQVALIDYVLGNWASVVSTAELAARMHAEYVGDFSIDPNERIEKSLMSSAFVLAALDHVGMKLPEGERFESPILDQLGLAEYQAQASSAFTREGFAGLREMAAGDLYGFPLGDLFESVETAWVALGIKWHATWNNDYETTVAAERLLSALQVLLADLAPHDIHTLPSTVSMVIRRGHVPMPEFSRDDRQTSNPWIITIPETAGDDSLSDPIDDDRLLALCFEMVRRISVLPDDQLMSIMEESIKQGVSSKLFVAKSYTELYREFRTREEFDAFPRIPNDLVDFPLAIPKERPEMAASAGLSPLYSEEVAQRLIRNRYQHVQEELPVTLARLNANSSFQETLSALREKGWKDWHVLQAIANIFYNLHTQSWFRMGLPPGEIGRRLDTLRRNQVELARLEVSSPIPMEDFSGERLERMLGMSMGATMKGLGLTFYDDQIELDAITEFMGEQFNFWNDDVEHVDPFAPPPSGIILPLSKV
ncbi:MAG: hypothetical protein ACR2OU_20005 [Thermomicrobiales bacterium]